MINCTSLASGHFLMPQSKSIHITILHDFSELCTMLIYDPSFLRRFKVCIAIKTQIRSTVEPICSLSIDESFKFACCACGL